MGYEIVSPIGNKNINQPQGNPMILDEWSKYVLSRRQAYFQERASIIGPEYNINKKSWDIIIEREWNVMEERLRGGIGVEQEVLEIFGDDFFQDREDLIHEIMNMTSSLPTAIIGDKNRKELKIYTFEDFLMLANQGIFRDTVFLLNTQSRWKKKVAITLLDYGYKPSQTIMLEGVRHYVIEKN
jgi:hypothetical protein